VVLLLSTAVATAAAPFHHLLLAFGDDRPYGLYLLAAAILNLSLNAVLIPPAGLVGAASATVVANILLAGLLWRAVNERVRTLGP
jgi:O-antigen/teichoic acid export membrane protein